MTRTRPAPAPSGNEIGLWKPSPYTFVFDLHDWDYYKLYERLSAELAIQPQKAPNIKIIDSATIDLCASVFPWAKFRCT